VQRHENDIRSAAQAAARTASLIDDYREAAVQAEASARANLTDDGVTCVNFTADLVSSEADFEPGGFVTVEVSCEVRSLPLIGPMNTAPALATEVIDLRRGQP
jgi:hypothetical protein